MAKQPYRGLPDMIADYTGHPRMSDEEWAEYLAQLRRDQEFHKKYGVPFGEKWRKERGLGRRLTMEQQFQMLQDFKAWLKDNELECPYLK